VIVATDAPRYDQDWLDRLFDAASQKQQFRICHFEVLTHCFSADQHCHRACLLRRAPIPHRAAPDALWLATRLMEAHLGYPQQTAPMEPTLASEPIDRPPERLERLAAIEVAPWQVDDDLAPARRQIGHRVLAGHAFGERSASWVIAARPA